MAIYDDVKAELGAGPPFPSRADFTNYFGYKGGERVGIFETEKAACAAGATVTEKVLNEDEYKAALAAYRAHQLALTKEWKWRVRMSNPDVDDEVFELAFSRAWDEGHSSGYREVESLVGDYVEFAINIIDAERRGVLHHESI